MAFTSATKETSALAATGLGSWISLHTADPGTAGTNEATGGSPAYARKQTTWAAGSADGVVNGSAVSFDVPAGSYSHIGVWSAATSGTFVGGFALSTSTGALPGQAVVAVTPSISVV